MVTGNAFCVRSLAPAVLDPRSPAKRLSADKEQAAPSYAHLIVQCEAVAGACVDRSGGCYCVAQHVESAEVGLGIFIALRAAVA